VYLTGDALRPFHPQYTALLRTDPLAMPNATALAVSTWVRSCIEHNQRFSLVLEGTFRDANVVADTVRRFAAAGYRTEAIVLAVRPERSRLDCLLRYLGSSRENAARWTPPTAHDTSFARLPHTVAAMHDLDELHRITVQTRTDTVYTNERDPGGRWRHPDRASHALLAEHERPLHLEAATAWLHQYGWAIEASEHLPSIDVRALPTYLALLEDADRIALTVTASQADQRGQQHAEMQRRAVALLARHDPSLASPTNRGGAAQRGFTPVRRIAPGTGDRKETPMPPRHDPSKHRRR
jgi:Zeta toxin